MATQLNISGLGENDDGALTVEQQTKLNHFKIETRLANEKYLRSHAEISHVTQAFIKEVLKKRPENVREFAAGYFSDKELKEKIQEENPENFLREFDKAAIN
ncbi:RIIa domain-containing protein 1-like isoform X1 [Dendronephthya gigantea]|uniref:RIIa domain-containing protein 1-like isoform X1 n=1 Tax=Dendronephthya gigantea TaxID=151771 RepID=UPI00106968BB|nr:RIIa domain-containing protein 1-like isoform X1 [Dendronephthya gigantea]